MPNTAFIEAVAQYWKALGQPGDPPELAESRLDAFIDVLHLTASGEHAFKLMELAQDPYPGIAVGDDQTPWRLHWAIQVGELEAFVSPALPDTIFLVDTIADMDGFNRVYSLKEATRHELEFSKLADALTWMTAHVRTKKGQMSDADCEEARAAAVTVLTDDWEDGPTSGWFVFEELYDAPLPEAWDAISRGQWPLVEGYPNAAPEDREDGWQRRLSLWLTMSFLQRRHVEMPADVVVPDMDAIHSALVNHLYDFEQAIHSGEIPVVIEMTASSDNAKLASDAEAWTARHDAWRTAAMVPAPEELDDLEAEPPAQFQHTPFTRQLMAVLSGSLDAMVEGGELELDPDRKEALLIEMVTAGSDARSVKHMLKKLTTTLVESEHVEEIYPNDDQIRDRFKQALGG